MQLWKNMMNKKIILKDIHQFVQTLKIIDDDNYGGSFGAFYGFIKKLTEYFFTIIGEQPFSIHNSSKSTTILKFRFDNNLWDNVH